QSDIYSLGVMFRDDLQLPKQIHEKMNSDKPSDRVALDDVMKSLVTELEKIPEAQRDPEVKAIIEFSKSGVRHNPDKKQQEKDTLVAQLMTGMRDPRDTEGESRTVHFSTNDYKEIALMIFAKVTPAEFSKQLIEAYQKLDNVDDKEIFLHNAALFYKELINMDINLDFHDDIRDGLKVFSALKGSEIDEKIKKAFDNMEQSVNEASDGAVLRKSNLIKAVDNQKSAKDGELDIQSYLSQKLIKGWLSTVLKDEKIKDPFQFKKYSKLFSEDIREQQIMLLKQSHIKDYYNKKSLDKPWETAHYQKIVDFNNLISKNVQQDILSAKNVEHQKRIFEFYFNVVEQSIKLGDFATASSIFSALEAGPVGRLEYLQSQSHLKKRYEVSKQLLSPSNGYKLLKNEVDFQRERW
ncbi:MAG TPA: RasGEF domain-containing protein, partial [Candidatus Berkiella sp.]|nr:RasGEF domain-containing protein [Candidatus Berkiella sp.]